MSNALELLFWLAVAAKAIAAAVFCFCFCALAHQGLERLIFPPHVRTERRHRRWLNRMDAR